MKRVLFFVCVLSVVCVPAFANLVVNGDFETGDLTGWTPWQASWSVSPSIANDGNTLRLSGSNGSFGVWQAITTVPGQAYTITVNWKGNLGQTAFWNEVLFFNDDGRAILDQLDGPLNSSVLSKVDGWGMNPPTSWDWQCAFCGTQWFPSGPQTNTIVATGTTMYVGLKTGASQGWADVQFDDVTVVPEPGSLLALAGGLATMAGMLRRRR